MPRIVAGALRWLRLDLDHVYAFGTSMGGQETLLLVGRHPGLLAGAAAFDSVTDMARRYYDFPRIRCERWCPPPSRRISGRWIQALARQEIGGTPATAARAYAARSPITYARQIAASGVPLQLWWSRDDHVVFDGEGQSGRLLRELRRLGARGPISAVTGSWPHSAEMNSHYALRRALEAFGLVAGRTVGDPLAAPTAPPPPPPPRPTDGP
jgi:pimeloyl-ACP methyl ester carboxylesterase